MKDPIITNLITPETKRRTRKESLYRAHTNMAITTHWKFMESMIETVNLDLMRQEEKLEQTLALRRKTSGKNIKNNR